MNRKNGRGTKEDRCKKTENIICSANWKRIMNISTSYNISQRAGGSGSYEHLVTMGPQDKVSPKKKWAVL